MMPGNQSQAIYGSKSHSLVGILLNRIMAIMQDNSNVLNRLGDTFSWVSHS